MARVKRPFLVLLCCLIGAGAAFAIWTFSPGPAWMAKRTARLYLEEYAPEYAAELVLVKTEVTRYVLSPWLYIKYPSHYIAVAKRESGDWDNAFRLELQNGFFPLTVTEASRMKDGSWEEP